MSNGTDPMDSGIKVLITGIGGNFFECFVPGVAVNVAMHRMRSVEQC